MNKLAKGLRLGGTGLVLAAFVLTGFNLWDDQRASQRAEAAVAVVQHVRQENMEAEHYHLPQTEGYQIPFYEQFPAVEMPVITVNGMGYIGTLEIPSQALELSVIESWDYESLRYSPCRYSGSVYTKDLIICAHNYSTHFGPLASLDMGEPVRFTDGDGNVFLYEVTEMEVLKPEQIQAMQQGDWDLTLFTCTLGGDSRVTLRCTLVDAIPV